jgi:hypothetical protein
MVPLAEAQILVVIVDGIVARREDLAALGTTREAMREQAR